MPRLALPDLIVFRPSGGASDELGETQRGLAGPSPSPPSAGLLPLPLTARRAWVFSCFYSLGKSPSWSLNPALTSVPKDAGGGLGAVRWGQRPAGSTGATELCSWASAPGLVGTMRVPTWGQAGACQGWEDEVTAFRTQSLFLAPGGRHSVPGCKRGSRPPRLLSRPRSFMGTVGSHQVASGSGWPLGSLDASEGLPPVGGGSLSCRELGGWGHGHPVCPTAGSKPAARSAADVDAKTAAAASPTPSFKSVRVQVFEAGVRGGG